jgi:hypothetical protein
MEAPADAAQDGKRGTRWKIQTPHKNQIQEDKKKDFHLMRASTSFKYFT